MFELKKFCEENGLFLLEDAAHAHGASINGYKAGSIGDVGSFSFFPTKLITTGEGGMVTTNNKEIADYVKQVRHHGQKNGLMTELGYNWRMPQLSVILGRYQLKRLDGFIEEKYMSYSVIDKSCLPVENYVSNVNIKQASQNCTEVNWYGHFKAEKKHKD